MSTQYKAYRATDRAEPVTYDLFMAVNITLDDTTLACVSRSLNDVWDVSGIFYVEGGGTE